MIVTRFAPSPTGNLHIGGARTALFNWLFARANNGKFLLRIEDTDRERSTEEAKDQILDSLKWLNLDWDGSPISQYTRQSIHREKAQELLNAGRAYKCFSTPEEISAAREELKSKGGSTFFVSPWRNVTEDQHPNAPFTIRLKTPETGISVIHDKVFGEISVSNDTIDDLIILRSDGTPTYNFAVVVDDHDMDVTHIIRGDDHLANSFKQKLIYKAFDWEVPVFAHVPLIHNEQGKKLSKREGSIGIEYFIKEGILPEVVFNFLARLGWYHGNDEIFTRDHAIKQFRLDDLRKSPSRLDFGILSKLSQNYLQGLNVDIITEFLDKHPTHPKFVDINIPTFPKPIHRHSHVKIFSEEIKQAIKLKQNLPISLPPYKLLKEEVDQIIKSKQNLQIQSTLPLKSLAEAITGNKDLFIMLNQSKDLSIQEAYNRILPDVVAMQRAITNQSRSSQKAYNRILPDVVAMQRAITNQSRSSQKAYNRILPDAVAMQRAITNQSRSSQKAYNRILPDAVAMQRAITNQSRSSQKAYNSILSDVVAMQRPTYPSNFTELSHRIAIVKIFPLVQKRSKNMNDVRDGLDFIINDTVNYDDKGIKILSTTQGDQFKDFINGLTSLEWERQFLENFTLSFCKKGDLNLGTILKPVRVALVGKTTSPSVYDILVTLGKEKSLDRLNKAYETMNIYSASNQGVLELKLPSVKIRFEDIQNAINSNQGVLELKLPSVKIRFEDIQNAINSNQKIVETSLEN